MCTMEVGSAQMPGGCGKQQGQKEAFQAPETPKPTEVFLLQAFMMSGNLVCELRCRGTTTMEAAKMRIARHCGIPAHNQRFLHDGEVLEDARTLESCTMLDTTLFGVDGMIVVQLVVNGTSNIARNVRELGRSDDPDIAIAGVLGDLVDTVLRAEHQLSELVRPKGGTQLSAALGRGKRAELVHWMVQAFTALRFDDAILHSVVLTLDRYYTTCSAPSDMSNLQSVLLGAVCTEMKLVGADEFPPGHWQQVLCHICHGQIELKAILKSECDVLARLNFRVGAPTPLAFARELGCGAPPDAEIGRGAVELASFLLELALFDPTLQYCRPHVLLAGGALSAALRVMEVETPSLRQGCREAREAIFQDLTFYDPENLRGAEQEALCCEGELLVLWLTCTEGRGNLEWALFYPTVEGKFRGRGQLRSVASNEVIASAVRACGEAHGQC
mmetsp:Transcript_25252/g.84293  ORF Transcript_25252/g.84293 Transcript_25252/m.84293 type:complete len:444 (-) Transcript_25252:631-1962(-)